MAYAPISIYNNILYAVIIFCKKKKYYILKKQKKKSDSERSHYCTATIKTTRAESRHAVQNNKSNSEKPFTLSSNIKLYSKNKMYNI